MREDGEVLVVGSVDAVAAAARPGEGVGGQCQEGDELSGLHRGCGWVFGLVEVWAMVMLFDGRCECEIRDRCVR